MAQRNTSVVHENEIGTMVIESAIAVHRELGPGLFKLKSVQAISPAHKREIQTYLKLADCRFGYLLNFPTALIKDGIVRAVNGLPDQQKTEELRASASLRAFQKLVNRYNLDDPPGAGKPPGCAARDCAHGGGRAFGMPYRSAKSRTSHTT